MHCFSRRPNTLALSERVLIVFFFCFWSPAFLLQVQAQCYDTDKPALIAFYKALTNTGNLNWDTSSCNVCDPNKWPGVTCNVNNRVEILKLDYKGLAGTIANEVGNLSQLKFFVLEGNDFTGNIPNTINNLTLLQELNLSRNELNDNTLPSLNNLNNLDQLTFRQNQLSGNIPANFVTSTVITRLDLGVNQLSGNIPASLGNLTTLHFLSLYGNELRGNIPPELGNLTNLQGFPLGGLFLHDNMLEGPIPTQLGNLVSTPNLWLYNNMLEGSIPAQLCNLTNLTTNPGLRLENNNLSGCIPACFYPNYCPNRVNISANPLLPWEGDFAQYCANNGGNQVGAPCVNVNTPGNDTINASCVCTEASQISTLQPVSGGSYTMGCTAGQQPCDAGTTAAHPVTVRTFYLAAREVTQAEYAAVTGANPSLNTGCSGCPVENVSWYDAVRFCNALSALQGRRPCYYADNTLATPFNAASGTVYWDLEADGYRLPTEAEWEYAARAGTDQKYAGSNTATDVGWFAANSGGTTQSADRAPNALGLYHLSGNVEEWVWDAFENYPAYAECDPLGPTVFGVNRVRRGGHYGSAADATVSRRTPADPTSKSGLCGFRVCSDAPDNMVYIPPGTYTMGCTPDQQGQCDSDENPPHAVTLSAFYMGKYEVTQGEWSALMSDINPSGTPNFTACGTDCPIERVSWFDAAVYCNRLSEQQGLEPCYYSDAGYTQVYGKNGSNWSLPNSGTVFWKTTAKGYRLPTEAEWEYAARGAGANPQTLYSGSDDIDLVAWYSNNSSSKTWPRGQKAPNALGLYDMSGNVWEWCFDWYDSYSPSPQTNPLGPASGSFRVVRGGSWVNSAAVARVANRSGDAPVFRLYGIGFRVCRSVL